MNKTQDGGPAFPVPEMHHGNITKQACDNPGMSLRCYIATAALQGGLADSRRLGTPSERAKYAIQCADAIIAELNKESK